MNPEAQIIFDKIVKKNPQDLSREEIEFIHARSLYLNDEQIRVFKDVLSKRQAEIDAINNPVEEAPVEPPIYVSKKDRKNVNNK